MKTQTKFYTSSPVEYTSMGFRPNVISSKISSAGPYSYMYKWKKTGPQGYKTCVMLNSTEHGIYHAHNVKCQQVILTFISMINTIYLIVWKQEMSFSDF